MRSERGQATVELVAVVPLLVLSCAIAWEVVLAGHAAWLAASAARAGARAVAVGRDGRAAARSVSASSSVSVLGGGRVRVAVPVAVVVPGWNSGIRVSATAGWAGGA